MRRLKNTEHRNELNKFIKDYIYEYNVKNENDTDDEKVLSRERLLFDYFINNIDFDKLISDIVNKNNNKFDIYLKFNFNNERPEHFFKKKYFKEDILVYENDYQFFKILNSFSEEVGNINTLSILDYKYSIIIDKFDFNFLKNETYYKELFTKLLLNYIYIVRKNDIDYDYSTYIGIIIKYFKEFNDIKNNERFFKKDYFVDLYSIFKQIEYNETIQKK